MKTKQLYSIVLGGFIGCLVATSLFAQNDWSRDAQVDVALVAGGMGQSGVLPPTAGGLPITGALPTPKMPGVAFTGVSNAPMATGIRADQFDHEGVIHKLEGKARVYKKTQDAWKPAHIGQIIEQGDHILTDAESYVGVRFDENYLNLLRVDKNTKVEFRTIEPNDIYLADGSIFNAIESLKPGVKATITTPTVVAAVRGTHFIVNFAALLKQFNACTAPTNDKVQNYLQLSKPSPGGPLGKSVGLPEGKELTLSSGQKLGPGQIEDASEKCTSNAKTFYQQLISGEKDVKKLQEEGRRQPPGGALPPTSGEFFEPGVLNAGGPGAIGGGENTPFDPLLDTGSGLGDPLVPSVPSEPSEHEGEGGGDEGGEYPGGEN